MNEKKSTKKIESKEETKLYKSFTRTKIINGHAYLYEITPYWDFIAGKQRQKSKYLAKVFEPTSTNTSEKKTSKSQRFVDFGDAYLIHTAIVELKLSSLLKQCFSIEDSNMILLTAGYMLLTQNSLAYMETWKSSTELAIFYPVLSHLSSSEIVKQLESIGQDETDKKEYFFKLWSQPFPKEDKYLVYDLESDPTPLYNKDYSRNILTSSLDNLPRFEMWLLMNQEKKLPLFYNLEQVDGIVNSNSPIDNKDAVLLAYPNTLLVYAAVDFDCTKLNRILNSSNGIIFPVRQLNDPTSQELAYDHRTKLESACNLRIYGFRMLQSAQGTLLLGNSSQNAKRNYINYTLFRDSDIQQSVHQGFLRELLEAENQLKEKLLTLKWRPSPPKKALHELKKQWKEVAKEWSVYFDPAWDKDQNAYILVRKNLAIQRAKACSGISLWYHTKSVKPDDILPMYEEKDLLEDMFHHSNSYVYDLSYKCQDSLLYQGLYFIFFISLILKYHLQEKIKHSDVDPKYTLSHLLLELRKIKKAVSTKTKGEISEITKTQQEIFEKLNLKLPKLSQD